MPRGPAGRLLAGRRRRRGRRGAAGTAGGRDGDRPRVTARAPSGPGPAAARTPGSADRRGGRAERRRAGLRGVLSESRHVSAVSGQPGPTRPIITNSIHPRRLMQRRRRRRGETAGPMRPGRGKISRHELAESFSESFLGRIGPAESQLPRFRLGRAVPTPADSDGGSASPAAPTTRMGLLGRSPWVHSG